MKPRVSHYIVGCTVSVLSISACSKNGPNQDTRRAAPQYYHPEAPSVGSAPATETVPPAALPATTSSEPPATCPAESDRYFSGDVPWNQRVDEKPLAEDSAVITSFLESKHSRQYRFWIDFSPVILNATRDTPRRAFLPTDEHTTPDCDVTPLPVPTGGRVEGEEGYACEHNGDCHLLIVQRDECRLFEMWRTDIRGTAFLGGCLAVWDLSKGFGADGRGDQCSSADAAGLPITPLLFTADEVAAGEINHALRFVLPNALIRQTAYVYPATHSTIETKGPYAAPPYGALLRLRADVDTSKLSSGAQVVARALKRYGMYLADGGNLTFTAASDFGSQTTWDKAGLKSRDLTSLSWTDFEVVEMGPRKDWNGGCARTPVTALPAR